MLRSSMRLSFTISSILLARMFLSFLASIDIFFSAWLASRQRQSQSSPQLTLLALECVLASVAAGFAAKISGRMIPPYIPHDTPIYTPYIPPLGAEWQGIILQLLAVSNASLPQPTPLSAGCLAPRVLKA